MLVCQRAKKLDAVTKAFLAEQANGVVLHLGCGLDSRFWRVDNGQVEWYDLDMPPVIELRRQFYAEQERYHLTASTVTDLDWTNAVAAADRPVLIVAEGLLMYLGEADVKRLFLRLREVFPGCRLIVTEREVLEATLEKHHSELYERFVDRIEAHKPVLAPDRIYLTTEARWPRRTGHPPPAPAGRGRSARREYM